MLNKPLCDVIKQNESELANIEILNAFQAAGECRRQVKKNQQML